MSNIIKTKLITQPVFEKEILKKIISLKTAHLTLIKKVPPAIVICAYKYEEP